MEYSVECETTVGEGYSTRIPESVRETADVRIGDTLRWTVDPSGDLGVEVIRRRDGFGSLDPIELDEQTDAAADHDETTLGR